MRKALFVCLFTAGCSSGPLTESVAELEHRAASVNDCCEIDGDDVGQEDHLVRLGSRVVLVHDWVKKDGVFVGFSITVSEGKPMSYLVKYGATMLEGHSTSFSTDGRAVTRVNFCDECDSPDGCEDGGEGDHPPGTPTPDDPDGNGEPGCQSSPEICDPDDNGEPGCQSSPEICDPDDNGVPGCQNPDGCDPDGNGIPGCQNPDGCETNGGDGPGPLL